MSEPILSVMFRKGMIDTTVDKPALVDQIIAAIEHALPSASERTSSTCLFTESPLQRFIASKASKKRRYVHGCNGLLSTSKRSRRCW